MPDTIPDFLLKALVDQYNGLLDERAERERRMDELADSLESELGLTLVCDRDGRAVRAVRKVAGK